MQTHPINHLAPPDWDVSASAFQEARTSIMSRAVDLLKSMKDDDERQGAAVYMDGLSQMRSEWGARSGGGRSGGGRGGSGSAGGGR